MLFNYISYLVLQQLDDLCQFLNNFAWFYIVGFVPGKQKQTVFDQLFMIVLWNYSTGITHFKHYLNFWNSIFFSKSDHIHSLSFNILFSGRRSTLNDIQTFSIIFINISTQTVHQLGCYNRQMFFNTFQCFVRQKKRKKRRANPSC